MKLDTKAKRRMEPQTFSNRVEVAITGLDIKNRRMTAGHRRSFRVNETTVDEVFQVIYEAIANQVEGGD